MTNEIFFELSPDQHPNGVIITGAAILTTINGGTEEVTIRLKADTREIILYDSSGNQSLAFLGTDGTILNKGNLKIGPLLGGSRTFEFYGEGVARGTGSFSVNNYVGTGEGSKRCLHFEGYDANLTIGMDKQIRIDGSQSKISLGTRDEIVVDGAAGDIIFKNADCAEEFATIDDERIDPGTVVVIASSRRVKPCSSAYDSKVIGIVSGGGDLRPGILLGKKSEHAVPVALLGTVYCKVTTENGIINEGDLLTTSSKTGHAMRASSDASKYAGTILGKSLGQVKSGDGLIPVLVTLR